LEKNQSWVRDRAKHALLAVSFLLALLLCACSSSEWVGHDVTAEHADWDQIDCQRWAARERRAEGFYGPGYGPYGPFASRRFGPRPVNRSSYHMLDEARVADFCMHAKGYQRASKN
jgi:hypothetical protein